MDDIDNNNCDGAMDCDSAMDGDYEDNNSDDNVVAQTLSRRRLRIGDGDDTGSASSLTAGGRVTILFHLLFVVNNIISSYDPWLAIFWNKRK